MMNLQRVCSSVLLTLLVTTCASFAANPNTGKFWHVTDFHYDPTYWSSQLSCNADVPDQQQYGDYWCDSSWKLVTSAIDAMAAHHSDVDFLIWTGDTVAHISDDHLSEDLNMDILQNLTTALTDAFPNKKVYASYGNHDYYPGNQFPPTNNAIYNRTAVMWQHWIEEAEQLANFRKGGYYTRLISAKLRVVALNTNLYYTSDKQTVNIPDPADQLAWLTSVLTAARTNGQKVLLTAHIPPGVHTPTRVVWFQPSFNQAFIDTLRDFTDVIAAMHYGHDHHDGFKVFYDKQGRAAVPLFVAPSVTPWRYKLPNGEVGPPHNPSIRLVTYDRDSGRHLDIQQLTLNLPQANSQGRANFNIMYNFTQHYNVTDLSAASLQSLVTRMSTGDEGKKLVDDYFRFATTEADQGDRTCDAKCRNVIVCGFKHYDYDSFDACVDDRTGSASGLFPATAVTFVAVLMTLVNFTL